MATKQSNSKSSGLATTMAELLSKTSASIKGFTRGQRIQAKLVEIGPKYAIFDVGGKSEGLLFDSYYAEARDLVSTLKPGQSVEATVIEPETADGSVLLSLRQAAQGMFWDNLEKAMQDDEAVNVIVRSASTRGLGVEIDGVSAFIPYSQIGKKQIVNLDNLVGKRIKAKVLELDRSKRRVLLSEKAVSEEKEIRQTQEALTHVKEGVVYEGIVTEVTSFGAFIKIIIESETGMTPVEGLVHVSELSWQKVKDPSDFVAEGDSVKVKVLGTTSGKLALSVKQAQDDPWTKVSETYKVDQQLTGKVIRHSDFGTFVELEPGLEGLIHITKIPPATKLTSGQDLEVYIEEIDAENRKISLGLVLTAKPVGYK